MKLIKDLGTRFPTKKSKTKKRYGLYECPLCHNRFEAQTQNVKSGVSTKCRPCADSNNHANMGIQKVGYSNKRIYNIYKGMRYRCNDMNDLSYGGKGIKICKQWIDYLEFEKWALGNGYSDDLTIDRIDNDGNYDPSNCRWTTRIVQSRNTRRKYASNKSGYRGVHWSNTYGKYIAKIKVNGECIYIGRFDDPYEASLAYDKYIKDNKLEHTKNA